MNSLENPFLIGHREISNHLLSLIEKERLPHGLLFQGPKGIGKATLAYHLARYLLSSHRPSFPIPVEDPVFASVSQARHPDLLILGEKSPLKTTDKREITIDEIRRVSQFIHLSPQEGGWRIVLIDAIDDLNRKAMNALLKALEEPPAKTAMILISHYSGGLLPTLRSRCQRITFHPLEKEDARKILEKNLPNLNEREAAFYLAFSQGSPGRAQTLSLLGGFSFYEQSLDLLKELAHGRFINAFPFLERLADESSGLSAVEVQKAFIDFLGWWIGRMIEGAATRKDVLPLLPAEKTVMETLLSKHSLQVWLKIWSSINSLWRETELLHLNRKSAFFTIFGWISGQVPLTDLREKV